MPKSTERRKTLSELYVGQVVHYGSRGITVKRTSDNVVRAEIVFQVCKKYPEFKLWQTISVPMETVEDVSYSTDTFLDAAVEALDTYYRAIRFRRHIDREIKRGIRAKVKNHLRKKHGSLPYIYAAA